jgi:hypothetical protein
MAARLKGSNISNHNMDTSSSNTSNSNNNNSSTGRITMALRISTRPMYLRAEVRIPQWPSMAA